MLCEVLAGIYISLAKAPLSPYLSESKPLTQAQLFMDPSMYGFSGQQWLLPKRQLIMPCQMDGGDSFPSQVSQREGAALVCSSACGHFPDKKNINDQGKKK